MSDLASRTQALEALFADIARTRMAGVPVLNAALQVEALGFEAAVGEDDAPAAVGVLLTPWFMNLVWLPLQREDVPARVGLHRERAVGDTCFEFIAAHEDRIGSFEACSLMSPVFEFTDHAQARATALAVLAELRTSKAIPPVGKPPARRAFLFGRSAAGHAA
jgi:[NiFe] hydrogenase assembly HybE family chaperone